MESEVSNEALKLIGINDKEWLTEAVVKDALPEELRHLVDYIVLSRSLHVMRAMRGAIEARKHLVTGFEVTRAAFWLDDPIWQALNAALEEKPWV